MQVTGLKNNQQTSFTSVNNPIKNFRLRTSLGNVSVQEFKEKDSRYFDKLTELSQFFIDNFIDGSQSPYWKKFSNPKNKVAYENRILRFNCFIRNIFKRDDGNSNVLIARDKHGEIVGGIITCTMNEIKKLRDPKTLYIDSLGVNKKYRNNDIAKTLIEKTIKAGKDIYSDSIVVGYNSAVPFYEKIGYKKPDLNNPLIKMYYNILRQDRNDVPKYSKLLTMPLKENEPRWWDRLSQKIITEIHNLKN